MYKRYYDGYSGHNMQKSEGQIIIPENLNSSNSNEPIASLTSEKPQDDISICSSCENRGFLNLPCDIDDLILIGILLFVILGNDRDDCDNSNDIFTLIILGIIIFSDILWYWHI